MRDERRRVLAMLANAEPRGQPYSVLLANGVNREVLNAIIRDGHADAVTNIVTAGRKTVPVSHVRITDAGRQALSLIGQRPSQGARRSSSRR